MSTDRRSDTIPLIPPLGMSIALLASELPENASAGSYPDWIKVTPRGPAPTRDGRLYRFTPETLVARFRADGIDVPADLNHAFALKGARGETADAVGWAKELQARPDGTYARMEWLDAGKAALATRAYRFISPTFHHGADGEATWLHSIALVAAPALSMPALASAMPGSASASTIAEALGLEAGADDAACLAAIGALREQFVPATLFADGLAALTASRSEMAAVQTKIRADQVAALITTALKDGKIVPAQRGQYEALCQSDAGLAQVASLFASSPPRSFTQSSGLDGRMPDAGAAERPEALAVRAGRYREAQAAAGITVTHAEATRFAHENPAAGR